MMLTTEPNIADVDDLYERLIALHEGRSEDESLRVNARLILLLLNHIGDEHVIAQAMELAARPA